MGWIIQIIFIPLLIEFYIKSALIMLQNVIYNKNVFCRKNESSFSFPSILFYFLITVIYKYSLRD